MITKTVRELHHEAMAFAQDAMIARHVHNDTERFRQLAAQALPLEVEAAQRLERTKESEPTRSILYLSAASLAWQAEDYKQARELVREGLSGFPSPRTEHNLHELAANIPAPDAPADDPVGV